jgi:hypothetical protein
MTERWDHSLEAQITSKMNELIACMCVVNFKQEGDRRGIIERDRIAHPWEGLPRELRSEPVQSTSHLGRHSDCSRFGNF